MSDTRRKKGLCMLSVSSHLTRQSVRVEILYYRKPAFKKVKGSGSGKIVSTMIQYISISKEDGITCTDSFERIFDGV
jgi:hypothetical protein